MNLKASNTLQNGDGPPFRERHGGVRSADGLATRAFLRNCNRKCQPALPAGLQLPPFVCSAPFPLLSAAQMARCLRARPAKMCGGIRTRAKVIQLDCRAFDATVHWNRQAVPAEEGFGDCQSVVVSYGAKCGFSGLLVAAEPGKMRTIAQKNRASCAVHVMLCCCGRILSACMFKVDKYLNRGEIFCAETERPNRDLIQYLLWRCWLQVHFCSLSDCWRNHRGCSGREQRRRSDFRFDDYVSSHYL